MFIRNGKVGESVHLIETVLVIENVEYVIKHFETFEAC